ncbi:MAG: ABC transporter permease [Eubacteriales bacterium]|nr:ABC transporter permease [Eubacteriales bacterium]
MKHLKELYNYREMIFSLVRKDLRGRYKGSVLGFLWTFINPLLQLVVYTLVFSIVMRAGYDKYYMFLFVALVPWMFFASSVQDGSIAILKEKDMVKKIYFPREVMPIATVTSGFVNMLLTFIVIFLVLIVTNFGVNFKALLCLPVVMIVEYILCLGVALIVSALTVYLRDLQYVLGILTMALQYGTPVMYGFEKIPEGYGWVNTLLNLNPMTPIITIYRQILYYKEVPNMISLLYVLGLGIVFIIIGFAIFNKLQKGFAENF